MRPRTQHEGSNRWECRRWNRMVRVAHWRRISHLVARQEWALTNLSALTLLSTLGSPEKVVLYNALTGVPWGTGATLGHVIGGALAASSAAWRWCTYLTKTFGQNTAYDLQFTSTYHSPPRFHPSTSSSHHRTILDMTSRTGKSCRALSGSSLSSWLPSSYCS